MGNLLGIIFVSSCILHAACTLSLKEIRSQILCNKQRYSMNESKIPNCFVTNTQVSQMLIVYGIGFNYDIWHV
jgi:hypothetical protein